MKMKTNLRIKKQKPKNVMETISFKYRVCMLFPITVQ